MKKLKRFEMVTVKSIRAKVLNPITSWEYDKEGFFVEGTETITGYRLTDGRRPAFWFVVPSYMIEELDE